MTATKAVTNRSAVIAKINGRTRWEAGLSQEPRIEPDHFAAPYRECLHKELNFAAKCRRSGDLDLARRALSLAAKQHHSSNYWQPIP